MALYKQVKVSVEPAIAESFKIACMDAGVSMAAELSAFMAAKSEAQAEPAAKAAKQTGSYPSYDTRPKRRRHVKSILSQLEEIKDYESAYRDNIPENLQAGPAYEAADRTVDTLEQVIELLNDAY